MELYPVLLNLKSKNTVVIGGGIVALRKVRDLLNAGARVTVISPEIHEDFNKLREKNSGQLTLFERKYRKGDLENATLVFSATDKSDVNHSVFLEAEKRGIFINAADDPPNCSFIIPSMAHHGDLIIALSTSGASPAMAARLRREFESHIPENIEEVLATLRKTRELLKSDKTFSTLDFSDRGKLLKKIVNDDGLLNELITSEKNGQLKEFLLNITNS